MIPLRDENPSATVPAGDARAHRAERRSSSSTRCCSAPSSAPSCTTGASSRCELTLAVRYGDLPLLPAAAPRAHLDVPARRLVPPDRQPLVPVDLRRQRRGRPRATRASSSSTWAAASPPRCFHYLAGPVAAIPTVGASGAIAAVLGAYIVRFPRARVLTLLPIFPFFQVVPLPAFFVLGLWFLFQFVLGLGALAASGGGIAFWAHVGGFVVGLPSCGCSAPRAARGRGWPSARLRVPGRDALASAASPTTGGACAGTSTDSCRSAGWPAWWCSPTTATARPCTTSPGRSCTTGSTSAPPAPRRRPARAPHPRPDGARPGGGGGLRALRLPPARPRRASRPRRAATRRAPSAG